MIFQTNPKCPHCNQVAPKDSPFCPNCGGRLAGGKRRCGSCGHENRSDAQFCGNCGQHMDNAEAPDIFRHRWTRREEEFAVRVEADDLPGLLKRGIKVEPGTNALIIEHGANLGQVPPGEYTLGTIGQRVKDFLTGDIPERVTILLVDITPTDMEFNLGGRFTKDPLPIGLTIRTQVQVDVEEANKFLINVLRGQERLLKEDIRKYLYPQVVDVADRWLRSHTLEELVDDPQQRARLELALEEDLSRTLSRTGLRFLQVRTAELNIEHVERIKGMTGKATLIEKEQAAKVYLAETQLRAAEQELETQIAETMRLRGMDLRLHQAQNEAELQSVEQEYKSVADSERTRLMARLKISQLTNNYDELKAQLDIEARQNREKQARELDLLAISEETRKVELEERRGDLYERMRQTVMNDKIRDVRSEADFKAVLEDLDHAHLLKEKDRTDLLQTWKDQGDDHEAARAHTVAKLQMERDFERQAAALKLRSDLSSEQLRSEMDLERMRLDRMQSIEAAKYEFELKRRREEDAFELRQRLETQQREFEWRQKQDEYQRQKDELDRKSRLNLGAAEHDEETRQMKADLELGLAGLRGMKQVRMEDELAQWELERQKSEFEWQKRKLEMELGWEKEKFKLEFEREFKVKQIEIDLQRERDHQAHDIKRLETIKDMGPDAIFAIAGPEQAAILADLRKTEALRGMSEEQILAAAAKDSPEVARAFQEKYRAMADGKLNEQQRELYERLIVSNQKGNEAVQSAQQETIERLSTTSDQRAQDIEHAYDKSRESIDRAMDRLAETAQVLGRQQASPPQPTPIIITPPGSNPQPIIFGGGAGSPPQAGAGEIRAQPETKTCPKCAKPVAFNSRFCNHCAYRFEGEG